MHADQSTRLKRLLKQFSGCRILVVGDVMVDEYIWGRVSRVSPEAPVPVVLRQGSSLEPGGAANVVRTLLSLGADVSLAGCTGRDPDGEWLRERLQSEGVDIQGLLVSDEKPTTVKTRIIAHKQQVVRVDTEDKYPLSDEEASRFVSLVNDAAESADAVILSDYAKGVLNKATLPAIIESCLSKELIVAVDPTVKHTDLYSRATVLTPNHHEAAIMAGREMETEDDVEEVGSVLMERLGCQYLVMTRGEDGMTVFTAADGSIAHIPAVAREVYDVTGAGDTVIGSLTLALAAGGGIVDSVLLSNYAAGIVVCKFGTATVSSGELADVLENNG